MQRHAVIVAFPTPGDRRVSLVRELRAALHVQVDLLTDTTLLEALLAAATSGAKRQVERGS